jgi:hypothetical protein
MINHVRIPLASGPCGQDAIDQVNRQGRAIGPD